MEKKTSAFHEGGSGKNLRNITRNLGGPFRACANFFKGFANFFHSVFFSQNI